MTQNEMISNLAEKCSVDSEEARTALEIGEWNMLTAAQLLESEKLRKAQEIEAVVSACETATAQATAEEPPVDAQTTHAEAAEPPEAAATAGEAEGKRRAKAAKHCGGRGLEKLGDHIRRLVACGNRNRLVVRHRDATLLELPVTVVAVLMLFAFWTCIPLLVLGLFLGCRYSFIGRDLGRERINDALDRVASAAEQLKGSAAKA